jgi:hypothetical protein
MLATFASIAVLGRVTEQRRHHWRRAIGALLARLRDKAGRGAPQAPTAAPHG